MTIVFGGGSAGTILRLACPHCRAVQVRAREKVGHRYRCQTCRRAFTREEGEHALRERETAKR